MTHVVLRKPYRLSLRQLKGETLYTLPNGRHAASQREIRLPVFQNESNCENLMKEGSFSGGGLGETRDRRAAGAHMYALCVYHARFYIYVIYVSPMASL